MAYNSATDTDVSGDATAVTVDFDSEKFDNNADFASDTFTAPVAGKYQFNACVRFDDMDTDTFERIELRIVTSNNTFYPAQSSGTIYETQSLTGALTLNGSVLADMDASDTATVQVVVRGGPKTEHIFGDAAAHSTFFTGNLEN